MAAKISKQARFNAAMTGGRSLSTAQVRALGFANVHDAAYQARQGGLNVQRFIVTNRKGQTSSVYELV